MLNTLHTTMSYNGIGLQTARGSGTSGHVQKNIADRRTEGFRHKREREAADAERRASQARKVRARQNAGGAIASHERRRWVEVQCMELRERLEDADVDEAEVETRVLALRVKLTTAEQTTDKEGTTGIAGTTDIEQTTDKEQTTDIEEATTEKDTHTAEKDTNTAEGTAEKEDRLTESKMTKLTKEPKLTDSKLTESKLTESKLTESKLTKSKLTESKLTESKLTEESKPGEEEWPLQREADP